MCNKQLQNKSRAVYCLNILTGNIQQRFINMVNYAANYLSV
ncbi:hypothetical protein X564_13590 [Pseudoalteromonas agarivorans]|nr:hypothetical protein X564_13590 [Pseudoalteromonas agarivorans]